MSKAAQETVTCPKCGKPGLFTMWASLNVTLNPDKKAKLLDGSLTRFVCPCGHSSDVVHPLLYHDMQQGVLIWMLPNPDGDRPADAPDGSPLGSFSKSRTPYRIRSVANRNELIEKIQIFDASFDDRLIEIAKLLATSKLPPERQGNETRMFYDRMEGEGEQAMLVFAVLSPSGQSSISLSRDAMFRTLNESFGAALAQPPSEPWPYVDRQYAIAMMATTATGSSTPASKSAMPAKKPWWKFWN